MAEESRNRDYSAKIRDSLLKLKYIYDLQDRELWYINVVKLGKEDIKTVNEDFVRSLSNDIYEIGLNLGSSLNGKELTVELYKFNESLTRLLSQQNILPLNINEFSPNDLHTINSDQETIHDREDNPKKHIDPTLLVKTVIKLLIFKLSKIIEVLQSSYTGISKIEIKLIDDILNKNISRRILKPYHGLIQQRAESIMASIY